MIQHIEVATRRISRTSTCPTGSRSTHKSTRGFFTFAPAHGSHGAVRRAPTSASSRVAALDGARAVTSGVVRPIHVSTSRWPPRRVRSCVALQGSRSRAHLSIPEVAAADVLIRRAVVRARPFSISRWPPFAALVRVPKRDSRDKTRRGSCLLVPRAAFARNHCSRAGGRRPRTSTRAERAGPLEHLDCVAAARTMLSRDGRNRMF